MLVLEEIGVEILMIAAVAVAAACLGYLLLLTVLEHVYVARRRRERTMKPAAVAIRESRDARPARLHSV